MPAELSRKILWDNPKRLYGIYGVAVGYHLAGADRAGVTDAIATI